MRRCTRCGRSALSHCNRYSGKAFWNARPVHIHIAEQRLEVSDCVRVHDRRPIERLFDLVDVDARYCLVHATHASAKERALMAASAAVVGICTTTEANLGDGLFALADLRARGGRWGIGSDSHIGLDPREELRWLEYQSRLESGRRTVWPTPARATTWSANLWNEAVAGGAQASGANAGGFSVGADADWLVVDDGDPSLAAATPGTLMGRWLFAPVRRPPLSVGVAGRLLVHRGLHPQHEASEQAFRQSVVRAHRQ